LFPDSGWNTLSLRLCLQIPGQGHALDICSLIIEINTTGRAFSIFTGRADGLIYEIKELRNQEWEPWPLVGHVFRPLSPGYWFAE
jgi:hypothetical protein